MTIESDSDLEALRRVGAIVRDVLACMGGHVRPGISTAELDAIGERELARAGVRPAPRLAYNFPGATCISVGDEAAHGLPGARVLREGELVNIDVSAEKDGYWADTGASFAVGQISSKQQNLCIATRTALRKALFAARSGRRISDIGRVVEREARRGGYWVVPELAGHGVGRFIHEEPSVPNYYDPHNKIRLREGMVIAIEPFLTTGSGDIITDADGWTLKMADGATVAQYEHTVVITRGNPIILT